MSCTSCSSVSQDVLAASPTRRAELLGMFASQWCQWMSGGGSVTFVITLNSEKVHALAARWQQLGPDGQQAWMDAVLPEEIPRVARKGIFNGVVTLQFARGIDDSITMTFLQRRLSFPITMERFRNLVSRILHPHDGVHVVARLSNGSTFFTSDSSATGGAQAQGMNNYTNPFPRCGFAYY